MTKFAWTPELAELARKRFFDEGWSAAQVAADFGGVSRNAVIGKLHRMSEKGVDRPARKLRASASPPPVARPRRPPPPRRRAKSPLFDARPRQCRRPWRLHPSRLCGRAS